MKPTLVIKGFDTGTAGVNAFGYLGAGISAAVTEGLLSTEEDTGFAISPETIKSTFTNVSDEEAADLAMIADGFLINGVLDAALGFASIGFKVLKKGGSGIRGAFDTDFVKDKAAQQAFFSVVSKLDPEIAKGSKREVAEGLNNLSMILEKYSETLVTVGQTSEKIPVDTVNALRSGANDYFSVTYQYAR